VNLNRSFVRFPGSQYFYIHKFAVTADVRAFDDSMQKRSSRSSKSKTDTKENSGSEEDEEDVAVPAKRKVRSPAHIQQNAARIHYLQGQREAKHHGIFG